MQGTFPSWRLLELNLVNVIQGDHTCDSHNLQNTLIMLITLRYKHFLGTNYIEVKDPGYVVICSKILSPIYNMFFLLFNSLPE